MSYPPCRTILASFAADTATGSWCCTQGVSRPLRSPLGAPSSELEVGPGAGNLPGRTNTHVREVRETSPPVRTQAQRRSGRSSSPRAGAGWRRESRWFPGVVRHHRVGDVRGIEERHARTGGDLGSRDVRPHGERGSPFTQVIRQGGGPGVRFPSWLRGGVPVVIVHQRARDWPTRRLPASGDARTSAAWRVLVRDHNVRRSALPRSRRRSRGSLGCPR